MSVIGATRQLVITAEYDDDSVRDVTAEATYTSSDESVAMVSGGGVVTAVADGTATISVAYGGQTVDVPVTVSIATLPPTLTKLTAAPTTVTLTVYGATQPLIITAGFDDASTLDVTGEAAYSSSDESVATVNAAGVVAAVSNGQANIAVTYQGETVNVLVIVAIPPALKGLTANPTDFTLTALNATRALVITAEYDDDSTLDVTAEATYTSSDESVATVSGTGVVTAIAAGTATITVTYGGQSADVPVTVSIASPTTVAGLVSNYTDLFFAVVGAYRKLTIMANYDDDSTQDVTAEAEYTSLNTDVATVSADGVVTAKANGDTTVTVQFGGVTLNVTVRVMALSDQLQSISAKATPNPVLVGAETNISVQAFYEGLYRPVVTEWATYEVLDPDLATVVAQGKVLALQAGTARIRVTFIDKESIISIQIQE